MQPDDGSEENEDPGQEKQPDEPTAGEESEQPEQDDTATEESQAYGVTEATDQPQVMEEESAQDRGKIREAIIHPSVLPNCPSQPSIPIIQPSQPSTYPSLHPNHSSQLSLWGRSQNHVIGFVINPRIQ